MARSGAHFAAPEPTMTSIFVYFPFLLRGPVLTFSGMMALRSLPSPPYSDRRLGGPSITRCTYSCPYRYYIGGRSKCNYEKGTFES